MSHTCLYENQPRNCQLGSPFKVERVGPEHRDGMIVLERDPDLCVAQRGSFLYPKFWNSGCSSLRSTYPTGSNTPWQSCGNSRQMFDTLFENHVDFTGNSAPPECYMGKCGYNSTQGWEYGASGKLNWQNS